VNNQTTDDAIEILMSTYSLSSAQIDKATKKNVSETVYQYFTSYCNYIKSSRGTGVPTHVTPAKPKALEMHKINTVPNGVLRAHVAKAEACLQMAILHLLQESVTGFIKCGLNLRRGIAILMSTNGM
jgi:restriction endonuclease Mrr